jgi:hypothetical protein
MNSQFGKVSKKQIKTIFIKIYDTPTFSYNSGSYI